MKRLTVIVALISLLASSGALGADKETPKLNPQGTANPYTVQSSGKKQSTEEADIQRDMDKKQERARRSLDPYVTGRNTYHPDAPGYPAGQQNRRR